MKHNFEATPNRRSSPFLNKWRLLPDDVLPMWIADMDLPTAPQIQQALHKQIEQGVLGYELPSKTLFEVIAARMKKLYDWDVDPDWFVYTAGVNNGYNIAARVLCSSKRGYLVQTPVYNEFLDTEQKVGVKQYVAPLVKNVKGNRISYQVDFDALRIGMRKAGMFLLCHPQNPVGHIYSQDELRQITEMCLDSNVTIVSDEIHSELLLGNTKFMPMAGTSRDAEKKSITLISVSKTFNVPGLSCGFAIIPNPDLRKTFSRIGSDMNYEVSTPGLTAALAAYSGKADAWLRDLRAHLTSNRDFILEYVDKYLPGVRATKPDATYLMWLDFSDLKLKPSPYEFILKRAKVALSNGAVFGSGNEQFVRLNFGTSRKILKQGLDRIRKALK